LSLQRQLSQLFLLSSAGSINDPSAITPTDGMHLHQSVSKAHTLLAIEREVIGAYMFFTWARVFAYLVHVPGWGPYLHAIIATIFEPIVIAFVMVVVMLNAAFTIMMYANRLFPHYFSVTFCACTAPIQFQAAMTSRRCRTPSSACGACSWASLTVSISLRTIAVSATPSFLEVPQELRIYS